MMNASSNFGYFIFIDLLRHTSEIPINPGVSHHVWAVWGERVCAVGSALLGIYGSYLVTRRYVQTFIAAALIAFFAPFFSLFGKGQWINDYIRSNLRNNLDVPDSASDLVFGLSYLFWAFVGQLLVVLFSSLH
jgi:hypothetical protein